MTNAGAVRIGVLVPAGNAVHEAEFRRLQPEGVEFRFAPFGFPPASAVDYCGELADGMVQAMVELKAWGARLLLVGCTTASMKCSGPAEDARLEALAGLPVITAAAASREAMAALGLSRVAVATPYSDGGNATVAGFLRRIGVEVAAIRGLGLDRSMDMWRNEAVTLPARRVADFALETDVPEAQAMYLPCTGVGSVEAIDLFEAERGKPAFSSVQAGYWASLRRLGIDGRRGFGGRLLKTWDFPSTQA
jgi:maleate isomerase